MSKSEKNSALPAIRHTPDGSINDRLSRENNMVVKQSKDKEKQAQLYRIGYRMDKKKAMLKQEYIYTSG